MKLLLLLISLNLFAHGGTALKRALDLKFTLDNGTSINLQADTGGGGAPPAPAPTYTNFPLLSVGTSPTEFKFPAERGLVGQALVQDIDGQVSWKQLGQGDITRIVEEEIKSYNIPRFKSQCTTAGPGANPLIMPAGFNGQASSDGCQTITSYTPVVSAAGTAFYFQNVTAPADNILKKDRTDMVADLNIPTGNTAVFSSDGAIWKYEGIYTTIAAFDAIRKWPVYIGSNVGIGTTLPYATLDVVGNIYATMHNNDSMHNLAEMGVRSIGMKSGNTADGFTGMKLNVKNTDSSGTAVANTSDIQFWTWGNGISVAREVARITERGRLGIGTADPTATLETLGNGFFGAAYGTQIGTYKLGIRGTSSNAAAPMFNVYGSTDNYPHFQILQYANNDTYINFDQYWNNAWGSSVDNTQNSASIHKSGSSLNFNSGSRVAQAAVPVQTTLMSLDLNNLRVGVGTTTPDAQLEIAGAAIPVLHIAGNTDNQNSATLFLSQADTHGFKISYDATNTNDGLRITERRADVETVRMNIVNGGKVQIGGTLPNTTNVGVARLEVNGDNGASTGPHMSFNNEGDIYPIRHLLNWSHDNIWDCWDCYYDGANLRNSNASSAFRWTKTATDLILDSVAAPTAGGNEAHTNRLWINENGNVNIAEDLYVSGSKIDGPAIARVINEETLAFNQAAFQAWCAWGGAGGAGANPLVVPAGINGLNVSDGCWGSPAFLPAVAAAGTVFYYLRQSGFGFNIATDRTDQAAQVGINGGWVASFRSDGATWIYQGQVPYTGRMLIGSTTQIGMGAAGQVLQTNGAGALSWRNAALFSSSSFNRNALDANIRIGTGSVINGIITLVGSDNANWRQGSLGPTQIAVMFRGNGVGSVRFQSIGQDGGCTPIDAVRLVNTGGVLSVGIKLTHCGGIWGATDISISYQSLSGSDNFILAAPNTNETNDNWLAVGQNANFTTIRNGVVTNF